MISPKKPEYVENNDLGVAFISLAANELFRDIRFAEPRSEVQASTR
jgi:hypothetical protein